MNGLKRMGCLIGMLGCIWCAHAGIVKGTIKDNQISKDRYSDRVGFNAQPDNINNMEYYYSARTTYNTQLTGRHTLDDDQIDWSVGYAYANRNLPDRRLIERTDRTNQTMGIYRISREFTRLDEHIASAAANYRKDFHWGSLEPTLKAGAYGEYRTRQFQYGWQPDNTLPQGFLFSDDIPGEVLVDSNYGPDKLYLYEEVNYLNNYEGDQTQAAGYVGVNLPIGGAFNVYAGVRYEYNRQVLRMNTRQYEESLQSTTYDNNGGYIGAFRDASDNWLDGWTNFDPQNTAY